MSNDKYKKIQREVERLEKERDQAIGAKKQVESTLKTEFNCDSVEEAEKLLRKLKKEQRQNERKFQIEFTKFDKAFREYLETMEAFNSGTPITKEDVDKFEKGRSSKHQKSGGRD